MKKIRDVINRVPLLVWAGVAIFALLIFPLILNSLILQSRVFDIVGNGESWLSFWATYMSSIASFAMVFLTWRTLKQMQTENRPYIHTSIVRKCGVLYLELKNVGRSNATGVRVHFKDEVINKLILDSLKNNFNHINDSEINVIPVGEKRTIKLTYSKLSNIDLSLHGGNPEKRTMRLFSADDKIEDLNKCFEILEKELTCVDIYYNKYKQKENINIAIYTDVPVDALVSISRQLEEIVKALNKESTSI